MSIFQCLDEATGLLMSTCQYNHCDKDEGGMADNCDVPPYVLDETNPPIIPIELIIPMQPIIPIEPIDSTHIFKCLKDVTHIEIRPADKDGKGGDLDFLLPQRMGGADVVLHHFIIENKNTKEEFNIDFNGTMQIWSGGLLYFDLTDMEGDHISFTEDAKGNVTGYKCDNES